MVDRAQAESEPYDLVIDLNGQAHTLNLSAPRVLDIHKLTGRTSSSHSKDRPMLALGAKPATSREPTNPPPDGGAARAAAELLARQPLSGRKILIVVENLPVPFDRRVWQEATTLRAAGAVVSVICPKGKGYQADYEEIDGIHIYRHSLPLDAEALAISWNTAPRCSTNSGWR